MKVSVTGNLKFQQTTHDTNRELTEEFRKRFAISADKPLIIAASTHDPEERYVLESVEGELGYSCRLMIAPRHPERFDAVEKLLRDSPYTIVRRSSPASAEDKEADVILLDSIGELREAYPLAEIVFVGGSLIPHGGQNILEPAAEGKAIVTGPYTHNFDAVVKEFRENGAVRQTSIAPDDSQVSERLYENILDLLQNPETRIELASRASLLMSRSNQDATENTVEKLHDLLSEQN